MARRPGEDGALSLGPRERRLLGWIVALVLVIGIAVVVGILGGNGDGTPVDPDPSASPSSESLLPITFGTSIDEATGEVAEASGATRFSSGDTFAYSVRPPGSVPAAIYVEVARVDAGELQVVQTATQDNEQPITPGRPAIAFTVAADLLLEAWGPGEYRMRIFTEPGGDPLAEGSFALLGAIPAASAAPSTSP